MVAIFSKEKTSVSQDSERYKKCAEMISNLAQSSSKCEADTNQLASILENRDQKLGSQHAPPHGPSKPDIASITSFLGKGEKMV